MKKIISYFQFSNLFVDLLYLIYGVLLFQWTTISVNLIGILLGVVIIVTSIYAGLKYYIYQPKTKNSIFFNELIYGVFGLIIALMIIFKPIPFNNIAVLGLSIWLLECSFIKALYAYKLFVKKEEIASLIATIAGIVFVGGLAIIIAPQIILVNTAKGIGIFAFMYGILDAMQTVLFIKRRQVINKIIK